MSASERRRNFRTSRQICVATEAAGEGINLQFCHLMVNYDLPWNPTRLEQRLGRIHRIGQSARRVRVQLRRDILGGWSTGHRGTHPGTAPEQAGPHAGRARGSGVRRRRRSALPEQGQPPGHAPRSGVRAETPRRLSRRIDQIDPKLLGLYEDATGIALARAHVDFSSFARANLEAEERRLMPRYVESHFLSAAKAVGLRTEARADGLWRIEHVLADLRSERLAAVRRLGKPDASYRKLTFYKETPGAGSAPRCRAARSRPPHLRRGR